MHRCLSVLSTLYIPLTIAYQMSPPVIKLVINYVFSLHCLLQSAGSALSAATCRINKYLTRGSSHIKIPCGLNSSFDVASLQFAPIFANKSLVSEHPPDCP